MKCPACYFNNRRGATECSSCGATLFAKDREVRVAYQQSAVERKHDEDMFTARYEQKRYGLSPQYEGESDAVFCKRINDSKTPYVIRELEAFAFHASDVMVAREPGEEG